MAPMATDPLRRARRWLREAERRGADLPENAALATVDGRGRPSVRYVLIKAIDDRGAVFYTNLVSRKGRELAANPHAALALYWNATGKQLRLEGRVHAVDEAEADEYWGERPPASRIASAVSTQSRAVSSRRVLLARYRDLLAKHPDGDIPRPAHWSGFRLIPRNVEFWERAEPRLHERELFTRTRQGWRSRILQP